MVLHLFLLHCCLMYLLFAGPIWARSCVHWLPQALLKNELETMRLVSLHPGVPTLHRSYDDVDHTMFVMDFVRGGPLLDQIVQRRTFTENDARATFHSALRTLNFMAKIGVVHRDLKVRRPATAGSYACSAVLSVTLWRLKGAPFISAVVRLVQCAGLADGAGSLCQDGVVDPRR